MEPVLIINLESCDSSWGWWVEAVKIRRSDLMRTSKKPIELVVLGLIFWSFDRRGVSLCIKPKKDDSVWMIHQNMGQYLQYMVSGQKNLTMHLEHEANLSTANISLYRTMQLLTAPFTILPMQHVVQTCIFFETTWFEPSIRCSLCWEGEPYCRNPWEKTTTPNLPMEIPNSPGSWSSKRSCESGSSSIPSKMPETHWLPEQFCNSAKLKLTWAPTFQGSNLSKETEEKRGWMNGLNIIYFSGKEVL